MAITKQQIREYMRQQGSKGGRRRAQVLSKEERRAIGRKAARVRWPKKTGRAS
jgi:hypothetical protein